MKRLKSNIFKDSLFLNITNNRRNAGLNKNSDSNIESVLKKEN